MQRVVISVLTITFLLLQSQLWFGEGSITELLYTREQIERQQNENERLYRRNRLLAAEVVELQNGLEIVEEQARLDLGMVRKDETFYLIYD
ncbi:cell division protein FtsB [Endozoicomonas montiporae]|uniref:Cell division protein FtsB n=2 Tax=Endozoicomonas montiporae TaxID=1027273 RepID=A0A081NBP7_9GAMM|nr:septum formation initiator family protein [Endozoicomonas montiporae]AMO56166.1 cell division protein FtsB [Endozoicomonas montiporae CL-33]KEQ15870.1 cell division protein FtsB [Endozoicomonas montiporae]